MRFVFHIDVNSAFLSWEAVNRLKSGETEDLRTVPAVVGGDQKSRRGIVLAKSIPAKRYGIKTGEPIASALRKCPTLTVVPSNYPLYQEYSESLREFLSHYSPLVEPFSVDECYLEYTGMERLFGPPVVAAHAIREGIKERLGFTVNVGVSENKLLAKMASDFQKPDRVHTLFRSELSKKMWPLPVSDLFMVGRSSLPVLDQMGIHTIGDLARTDPKLLTYRFKSQGITLWNYANGIDPTPVAPLPPPKSVGNSVTLPRDAKTKEEALPVLLKLSESVGSRLRHGGFQASLISIVIKNADFSVSSHQQKLSSPISSTNEIYRIALSLFDALWDASPIRLLGVSASTLSRQTDNQFLLWESAEQPRLDGAVDSLRDKFGAEILTRGRTMKSDVTIRSTGPSSREYREMKNEKE